MTGRPGSVGDETLPEAFWSVARQLPETSREALAPLGLLGFLVQARSA